MSPSESLSIDFSRVQRTALIIGVVGLATDILGLVLDREHFFQSYLFAFLFWNALSLGSLGLYLLHNVVGGNWGVVIRRFLEAGARTFPATFIAILPLLFVIPLLYVWARPEAQHDANIQLKAAYLNVPFFIVRAVFYFIVWFLVSLRLTTLSQRQDETGDLSISERMRVFSAPMLIVFVFTVTFAFFDWIMSLEPQWFSTVYGIMFLVGQVLETLCFAVALLFVLSKRKPFVDVLKVQHFHDLGNLMLAFTMLWAYLSLAQFLIIWAGNLPEEIPWYVRRFSGGWGYMGVFIGIFHFCVPFVILLMRFVTKRPERLARLALYIIAVRFIDVFWIVEPAFRQRQFSVYWTDIVTPIGMGGLWIWVFLWRLKQRPLLPLHDPRLAHHPLQGEV